MTLQMKIDYKMAKKEDTLISNSIMMYSVKQMVKNKPIIFLLDIKMKRATTVFYIQKQEEKFEGEYVKGC